MEDQEQPFAAFVLDTLTRRSMELAEQWAEDAQIAGPALEEVDADSTAAAAAAARQAAADLIVRAVVTAADDRIAPGYDPLIRAGRATGAAAHRQDTSLHLLLRDLDLLAALLLGAAERGASDYRGDATGREGLALARRISDAMSQLRLAATRGYMQSVEDGLRERYRAIRHDLRNPLGTIKSAIALLTDESAPAEMRQSPRVRAMVVRNARSLDQMIGTALGDAAARLPAFGTPPAPADSPTSRRQQRDNVAGTRQAPDLESGTF